MENIKIPFDIDDQGGIQLMNNMIKVIGQLEKELKQAGGASEDAFKGTNAAIEKMKAETEVAFDQIKKGLNKTEKETGNFKKGLNGIKEKLLDSFGPLRDLDSTVGDFKAMLGKGGLIGIIGVATVKAGIEVNKLIKKFQGLRDKVEDLTGETGNFVVDNITTGVKAVADTFDKDFDEVLKAVNTLTKEVTGDFSKSLELIEKGFIGGADAGGDFLDQIREYSTQIRQAGADGEEFLEILIRSQQEGIFSDKGIDTIKEFDLKIKEQTKATRDALEGAFGADFTNRIFNGINNGSLKTIDALKSVAKQMKDTKIPANQLQTVVADVFGGAGEDAGLRFLTEILSDLDGNLDDVIDSTSSFTERQKELLQTNKDLTVQQNLLTRQLDNTGFGLDTLGSKIKTALLFVLNDTILQFRVFARNVQAFVDSPFNPKFINRFQIIAEDLAKQSEEDSKKRQQNQKKEEKSLKDISNKRRSSAEELKKEQEQEEKRIQKLKKEYQKLIGAIEKQTLEVDLSRLSPVDRLKKEQELALAELEQLKQSVIAKAKELGNDLPEGFDQSFAKMGEQIIISFQREIQNAIGDLPSLKSEFEPLKSAIEKDLGGIIEPDIKIKVPEVANEGFFDSLENVKENILDALGIDEGEGREIIAAIGTVFNQVNSLITAGTEQQIAIQERLIQKIDDRISQAQSAVDEEKELAEKGFANNLSIKKKELEGLQKEREKAENERLAFERKAAKQRLLIESLQQISGLVTASSNIFKAFSAIPFVGVPLALAAIGTMFGVFAKTKIDAKKAATSIKLAKGGRIPTTGRTDKGSGRGHRVEDTNVVVGAGEWVTNAETSQIQDQFFQSLNKGKYNQLPLKEMADAALQSKEHLQRTVKGFHQRDKEIQVINIEQKQQLTKEVMADVFKGAMKDEISRLIDFQKGKTDRVPLGDNRYIEIIETDYGKTTKTVTVNA